MGWLALFILWASTQSDVPSAPPPPPDPTAQMWVGIGMGVVLAFVLSPVTRPLAFRAGHRLGGLAGSWTSRIGDVRIRGE